jgi:hypothetical protein
MPTWQLPCATHSANVFASSYQALYARVQYAGLQADGYAGASTMHCRLTVQRGLRSALAVDQNAGKCHNALLQVLLHAQLSTPR